MLRSLGTFALHTGYRGLVILFDEAEMSYSVMRRSDLKSAHNNLLHLINGVDESEGLFLVYATTHEGWNVPLIGAGHRWAAGAIMLLGAFTCGLGSPARA